MILTEGLKWAAIVPVVTSILMIAVGVRIYRFATADDQ